jgi:hypothetical protein
VQVRLGHQVPGVLALSSVQCEWESASCRPRPHPEAPPPSPPSPLPRRSAAARCTRAPGPATRWTCSRPGCPQRTSSWRTSWRTARTRTALPCWGAGPTAPASTSRRRWRCSGSTPSYASATSSTASRRTRVGGMARLAGWLAGWLAARGVAAPGLARLLGRLHARRLTRAASCSQQSRPSLAVRRPQTVAVAALDCAARRSALVPAAAGTGGEGQAAAAGTSTTPAWTLHLVLGLVVSLRRCCALSHSLPSHPPLRRPGAGLVPGGLRAGGAGRATWGSSSSSSRGQQQQGAAEGGAPDGALHTAGRQVGAQPGAGVGCHALWPLFWWQVPCRNRRSWPNRHSSGALGCSAGQLEARRVLGAQVAALQRADPSGPCLPPPECQEQHPWCCTHPALPSPCAGGSS